MRAFFLILTLFIYSFSFGQQKTFKQRSNHVVYVGLTNSMYWYNFEGLNDANNVIKRQFQPSIEVLGYLFSYEINNKIRSEEHTSELQSRPQLVCRLLLEEE